MGNLESGEQFKVDLMKLFQLGEHAGDLLQRHHVALLLCQPLQRQQVLLHTPYTSHINMRTNRQAGRRVRMGASWPPLLTQGEGNEGTG